MSIIVENPLALAYILPADVYLLAGERAAFSAPVPTPNYEEQLAGTLPVVNEPVMQPEPTEAPTTIVLETPATVTPAIETPVSSFNYAGSNAQRFLILVHYPRHDVMEPGHLSALESTIKRKELTLDDVAILNIGKHPNTELKALGAFFKPRKMLLLGSDAFPIGLTPPVLNQLSMLGKCQLLYSVSFGEMIGNKEATKAFWEQMKAL